VSYGQGVNIRSTPEANGAVVGMLKPNDGALFSLS